MAQVAIGKLECLGVFGDDYDTPDGTGVRDYIHVVDLAVGHVKAVEKLADKEGVSIYNLGTGNGYSVLQVVHAFEKACGHPINYQIKPRRPGDIAMCYCDPARRKESWAGRLSTASRRCARIPGDGRATTRTGMPTDTEVFRDCCGQAPQRFPGRPGIREGVPCFPV